MSTSGRAIQFVAEKNGVYSITEESIQFLSAIDTPFAVISVCGPYRFLGKQKAFNIGSTINPETRGIYVWNEIVNLVRPDTQEIVPAIIMDTEGISSLNQDKSHDVKILSLSLLLSEYLVYNSMGVIDEGAIETLSVISQVAKHLAVKVEDKRLRVSRMELFPRFAWVLRDFSLELTDENRREITPNQYMERSLQDRQEEHQKDKNETRKTIRKYFQTRDCFCLIKPTHDETELRHIDLLSPEKLRPDFINGVNAFVQTVTRQLPIKKLFNTPMNGHMFVELAQRYIRNVNTGVTPTIMDTWKGVAETENLKLVKKQKEDAQRELNNFQKEKFPINQEEFDYFYDELMKHSKQYLETNLVGDDINHHLLDFENTVKSSYHNYCNLNNNSSQKLCQSSFTSLYTRLVYTPLSEKRFTNPNELINAWEQLFKSYKETAKGSAKVSALADLFPNKSSVCFLEFFRQMDETNRCLLEKEKNQQENLKKEISELEKQKIDLQINCGKLSGDIEQVSLDMRRLQETIKVQQNNALATQESLQKTITALETEVASKNNTIHQSVIDLNNLHHQLELSKIEYTTTEDRRRLLTAEVEKLNVTLQEKEKNIEHLNQLIKLQKGEFDAKLILVESQLREMKDARDKEVAELRREVDELREVERRLREVSAEKEELERRLREVSAEREEAERRLKEVSAEREVLERRLKEATTERELFEGRLKEAITEREEVERRLREVSAASEQEMDRLKEMTAEREELMLRLSGEQKELNNTQDKVKEYQMIEQNMKIEINRLTQDVEGSRSDLEKQCMDLKRKLEANQLLREEMSRTIQGLRPLKQENDTQLNQLEDEKPQMSLKTTDHLQLEAFKNKLDELEKQTELLKSQNLMQTAHILFLENREREKLIVAEEREKKMDKELSTALKKVESLTYKNSIVKREMETMKKKELEVLEKSERKIRELLGQNIPLNVLNDTSLRTGKRILSPSSSPPRKSAKTRRTDTKNPEIPTQTKSKHTKQNKENS